MFNVFGKRMKNGVLEDVGHAVYAFRNLFGRLRIMNRGGMLTGQPAKSAKFSNRWPICPRNTKSSASSK